MKSTWIPTWHTLDDVSFCHSLYHAHHQEGRLDLNSSKSCILNKRYNLWTRVKDPHNYMVTALASCVTWSLNLLIFHGSNTMSERPRNIIHLIPCRTLCIFFSSIEISLVHCALRLQCKVNLDCLWLSRPIAWVLYHRSRALEL
jgi:hypothetical protein